MNLLLLFLLFLACSLVHFPFQVCSMMGTFSQRLHLSFSSLHWHPPTTLNTQWAAFVLWFLPYNDSWDPCLPFLSLFFFTLVPFSQGVLSAVAYRFDIQVMDCSVKGKNSNSDTFFLFCFTGSFSILLLVYFGEIR